MRRNGKMYKEQPIAQLRKKQVREEIMKKKILSVLLATTMVVTLLAGCGKDDTSGSSSSSSSSSNDTSTSSNDTSTSGDTSTPSGEKEDVHLVVWASELTEIQAMTRKMIEEFVAANADKVNLTFDLGAESESTAKDTILTDITAAADVFAFADDQIYDLVTAGALQEVLINTDQIIAANNAGAVAAATVDGKLYAYPMTADNGYFMYYNSSYFTEDDVKSFDRMLEVAQAAGKQITMEMHGAWYNYSFFKGAGFEARLQDDGTNFCNWNGPGGTHVLRGMLDIAAHPAFVSLGDAEFQTGVTDGSLIAGINGSWNASTVEDAWGDNYAAVKLPTFTSNGQQVQMGSFAGFKLVGVNAFSQNTGWAMMLAEWLTNYENQVTRFNTPGGGGPSNLQAAASDSVTSNPAQKALIDQSAFATVQYIGGNYWSPAGTLGEICVQGNPDGTDLQELLDMAVEGITAP